MEGQYLSDDEIASQYSDYEVTQGQKWTDSSGGMQIELPHGESRWNNFTKYADGSIAFDQWYPPEVYKGLCEKANEILNGGTNE